MQSLLHRATRSGGQVIFIVAFKVVKVFRAYIRLTACTFQQIMNGTEFAGNIRATILTYIKMTEWNRANDSEGDFK